MRRKGRKLNMEGQASDNGVGHMREWESYSQIGFHIENESRRWTGVAKDCCMRWPVK